MSEPVSIPLPEEVLERMARAIDPEAWAMHDRYLRGSDHWRTRAAQETVELSLSKARAALDASGVRGVLRNIAEGTYPPARNETGQCAHGERLSDGCFDCIEEYARDFLAALSSNGEG